MAYRFHWTGYSVQNRFINYTSFPKRHQELHCKKTKINAKIIFQVRYEGEARYEHPKYAPKYPEPSYKPAPVYGSPVA